MLIEKYKYSYNDVAVIPADISDICHRSDVDPYTEDGMLPIFTAPMDTVVNEKNFQKFIDNKITPILPRNFALEKRVDYATNNKWAAFSLEEFFSAFCNERTFTSSNIKALIDVANGHMECLYEAVKQAKAVYGNDIKIMVGNIANPDTYKIAYESGADYVRCSVGTGMGCFVDGTVVQTDTGTKNIEDIQIGDSVLTIDGTFQKVTNKTRFVSKNILIINNEVECTQDHKFFVINKCDKDKVTEDNLLDYGFWVEAEKLDKDKHLLVKKE